MGLRKNLLRNFQNYGQGKCYVNFYNIDVLEYAQTRANSKNQALLQPAPGMHRFVQLKMADSY